LYSYKYGYRDQLFVINLTLKFYPYDTETLNYIVRISRPHCIQIKVN